MARISAKDYRALNENTQLGLPAIFENLRIGGGRDKQRVAFAPEFVQERILADGVFADLNPEARRVIYLVSETGLRLSEACNLSRTTIRLNAPVPHVQIRPEGREIKIFEWEDEDPEGEWVLRPSPSVGGRQEAAVTASFVDARVRDGDHFYQFRLTARLPSREIMYVSKATDRNPHGVVHRRLRLLGVWHPRRSCSRRWTGPSVNAGEQSPRFHTGRR